MFHIRVKLRSITFHKGSVSYIDKQLRRLVQLKIIIATLKLKYLLASAMFVTMATCIATATCVVQRQTLPRAREIFLFYLDCLINNTKRCSQILIKTILKKTSKFRSLSIVKYPQTVRRTMGKRPHWPQHRTPVGNEWTQNRRCVTVWDSRFSWLFVYVRGTSTFLTS